MKLIKLTYCLIGLSVAFLLFSCSEKESGQDGSQDTDGPHIPVTPDNPDDPEVPDNSAAGIYGQIPDLNIGTLVLGPGKISETWENLKKRYCVAGDGLELSVKSGGVSYELSVHENASELVSAYNDEYYSNSTLLPAGTYSLKSEVSGGNSIMTLDINQAKVFDASSNVSFVLPLQVRADGVAKSDVFYVFVPSYTEAGGMVTVHLSGYATLDIYYSDKKNDKAVIYCPGGGYSNTSLPDMDTKPVFRGAGVTAGVLWYRKPTAEWQGLRELPLTDVKDALAVLKAHSSRWGGYTKFGIAGRSAGGHLAAVSAAYNKKDFDFQVLLYPVITMEPDRTHAGSMKNFLGSTSPSRTLVDAWSAEKLVTEETPRAYVAYSLNDSVVPQKYNGKAMCMALQNAGVNHLAKEYETGGHSINWPDFPKCLHEWLTAF